MDEHTVLCPICDSVMVWNEETKELVCPECKNRAILENNGLIYFEHE